MNHETGTSATYAAETNLQVQVILPELRRIRFSDHHNSKQYTYKKRQPKKHGNKKK